AAFGGDDLCLVLGSDDRPEVVAYLVAQRVLLGGQIDEHGGGGYDGPRAPVKRAVVRSSVRPSRSHLPPGPDRPHDVPKLWCLSQRPRTLPRPCTLTTGTSTAGEAGGRSRCSSSRCCCTPRRTPSHLRVRRWSVAASSTGTCAPSVTAPRARDTGPIRRRGSHIPIF